MELTKIYPIYKNLVDVFFGDGWVYHLRLHKQGKEWKIVSGELPKGVQISTIVKEVESYVKSR